MLRKYIAILMIALAGIVQANAQSAVGSWYTFPVFSGTIDQIVDGKSKVFFTTANKLYSFDKDSNELYAWGPQNSLNDSNVSKIYYNPERGYLVVAYDTSNIDVINETNGRVINMADIKSAGLNSSKKINDVAFGDGRIYVATDFGLVVYNDKDFQVIESGIYNQVVKYVAESDGLVVINIGARVLASPVDTRHNALSKFTQMHGSLGISSMDAINGGVLVYFGWGKSLYKYMFNKDDLSQSILSSINLDLDQARPALNRDGKYVVKAAGNKLVAIDMDANIVEDIALPAELANQTVAMGKGPESVWAGDKDGVGNFAIASDGSLTTLANKIMPTGTMSFTVPTFMEASADGSHIYVGKGGISLLYDHDDQFNFKGYAEINVFVDGEPRNVTPDDVNLLPLTGLSADPLHPNRYAFVVDYHNAYVVEDGEIIFNFNKTNAPIGQEANIGGIQYDSKGNLWIGQQAWDTNQLCMLPAEKLNGSSELTIEDWKVIPNMWYDLGIHGQFDFKILLSKKYPRFGFFSQGTELPNTIGIIDRDNMKGAKISPVIDQDGKTITFDQIIAMCEDQRGRIWMGTANGIFEITNPSEALNADFRVNHIKVPRNDGTNFADYLLDSETVYSIAIDGSNRKWIGTRNSGLYLVSENGDEIIANYNVDNSDIPSNTVYSVLCDPNSNLVYVGTKNGLATLGSSSAPSAPSYADIYAYPNPVKPGYTGYITVRGLMDDSLVKIADSAGNVVHQGRSNGGMFVWDGNNSSGQRVSSGVYYVFASQNANDSASAAVTKIVVIN